MVLRTGTLSGPSRFGGAPSEKDENWSGLVYASRLSGDSIRGVSWEVRGVPIGDRGGGRLDIEGTRLSRGDGNGEGIGWGTGEGGAMIPDASFLALGRSRGRESKGKASKSVLNRDPRLVDEPGLIGVLGTTPSLPVRTRQVNIQGCGDLHSPLTIVHHRQCIIIGA